MLNSSLRKEPRDRQAPVLPSRHDSSLLDWLESSGRLIARDTQEPEYLEDEDPEISGIMDVEDVTYDIDDDDDILIDDE